MPDARPSRGYVIRGGEHRSPVRPARMSSDLSRTAYVAPGLVDPRLVDPHLEAVVEQAAMEARARGFRAGHSAGYEAGRQEGLALLDQQRLVFEERDEIDRERRRGYLLDLIANVGGAIDQALQVQTPTLTELYDVVATMTVELAESLVGHHLEVDGCGARDALLRAMTDVPSGASVNVRLHPDDCAAIADFALGVTEWSIARIVPDAGVEPGGAVVQAQNLEIDAQYGPAFDRMRKVVRP